MELESIRDLLKRRKKLQKLLEPMPLDEFWTAEEDAACRESIRRELADLDAQIAERTGRSSGSNAKQ